MQRYGSRHFQALALTNGLLTDLSTDPFPTRVYGWEHSGDPLKLPAEGNHFGFILQGPSRLNLFRDGSRDSFQLREGMYFSVPSALEIEGGSGIIVSRLDYHGFFSLGGPIESVGRLRYIDGCSDSLIIPPVRKGDPCLNHLHFPPQISQTRHAHSSVRVGAVIRGEGRCVVPANDDGTGPDIDFPLVAGKIFIIPANGHHGFFTEGCTMDVIGYHPDSDTGPDDDDHPMINRTLVDGVPASKIEYIKTKTIST